MIKKEDAIKDLVRKEPIPNQETLVERLKTVYGIQTNQVAVSRDIRKLGIIKKPVRGRMIYELPSPDVQAEILRIAVTSVEHNESIIAIKTLPGIADFVGDFLDAQTNLDIMGCLSGENIIFVTPKSVKTIEKTYSQVCELFQFKPQKEDHV